MKLVGEKQCHSHTLLNKKSPATDDHTIGEARNVVRSLLSLEFSPSSCEVDMKLANLPFECSAEQERTSILPHFLL